MKSIICDAIHQRRILKFYYDGGNRLAEPFCYGRSFDGSELLRGFQVGGFSQSGNVQSWKLFKVEEMTSLFLTEEVFENIRLDYNPNDPIIKEAYCRI